VIIIDSAFQAPKVARGTKRICQSCEVRFYDLARDPIVCPSCGAQNVATAPLVMTLGTRAEGSGGKTTWRSKPPKYSKPVLPAEPDPVPEIAADASEEEAPANADQDLVLEQEADEGDVTDWVDRDAVETKDT
jgi:hypothetical protein